MPEEMMPDLDQPATKGDLRRLENGLKSEMASKAELSAARNFLGAEIFRTREDMSKMKQELRGDMDALRSDVNGKLDGFLNKMETLWGESKRIPETLDAHGAALQNHENRIKALERQ